MASPGGSEAVQALVEVFYDDMEVHEPALAAVHQQDYTEQHGHPRLRMRHNRVPVRNVPA